MPVTRLRDGRAGLGLHLDSEGWDMLYNIHFMLQTTDLSYVTKHCSIYNMLYSMSMRRLYNSKTCYIYNLHLIYTFEYNTL